MKRNFIILCVLTCFCAFSTGAYAQQAEEPVVSTNVPPDFAIDAEMGFVGWGDVNGATCDVAVGKLDLDAQVPFVDFGYSLRHFEFVNANTFFGGAGHDPFGDLHQLYLNLNDTRIVYEEQFGYHVRAEIQSNFEKQMSNSFAYEAEAGLVYEYDENLMIIAGAMYHWNETNYYVMPTGSIRYRAFADEGLSIIIGLPETSIAYQLENGLGAKLSWAYEKTAYRLGNHNDFNPRGFIEIWDQILALEGSWKVNDNVKLVGGVTYNFKRDLKSFTEGGNRNFTVDVNQAFGCTGSVVVNF
ncbi:MAG: hypothetical protein JW938_02355 [Candidatus Omnitrophica bacterium]|nr:hypothetical protein [Candidatus Omnitrophota bacterium]